VYVDRHTTYRSPGKRTLVDELAGRTRPQSQFERALEALGVRVIPAYSPQAKGRIERLFGTYQDRLIKELRLAGAKTREEANAFLEAYLPSYNRRFSVTAQSPLDLHRPAPPRPVLHRILAMRETHALRNDNTVQHQTKTYLLHDRWNGHRPKTIQAEVRLNGKLYLLDGDRPLRYRGVAERPRRAPAPPRPPHGSQRRRTPAPDHPWRQFDYVQRLNQFKHRTLLTSRTEDISIGR